MAYKSGVAIIVTYQAAAAATGLTIKMDIYDEAHALDGAKSVAAMTEIGTTGRYYATFTPDAAGEWIALMYKDGGGGEVVKAFRVATVDEFGIKTVVDGIQTDLDNVTDGLGAIKTAADGAATPAEVATELGTYDAPTKAELDVLGTTALATASALTTVDNEIETIDTEVGVIDGFHDVPTEDAATDAQMRDVVGKKTDTVGGTSIVSISKQVKAKTDNIPASPAPASEYDTEMGYLTGAVATAAALTTVDTEVGVIDGIVDDILVDTAAIDTATGATGGIRGADGDSLKTLSDQLDVYSSPAMVG